jgi:DNA-binding IclR family transcriptional regulator
MSKPLDPEHPGRFSSSLVVGLAMLKCFTPEHPERGIADMAEELDLGRSTTHRYAATLVALGYLEQGPSRKYRLAPRVADVGLSLLDSMAIRQAACEPLRELRARTGRTASLGVLWSTEVAYIDRRRGSLQGQYAVDEGIGVGACLPIHCTAAGKALLALLPAAEQQELIRRLRLTRRTPTTITTKAAVRTELEGIAADGGVAVEDEELSAGRRAIAAVVAGTEGQLVAAVELAVPAEAYTRKKLFGLGPEITATAKRIAEVLDWRLQET